MGKIGIGLIGNENSETFVNKLAEVYNNPDVRVIETKYHPIFDGSRIYDRILVIYEEVRDSDEMKDMNYKIEGFYNRSDVHCKDCKFVGNPYSVQLYCEKSGRTVSDFGYCDYAKRRSKDE